MDITETKSEKSAVLSIKGRIDSGTSTILEKKLIAMIDIGRVKNIVLDFAAVDYISSAGLRVLLMTAKKTGKLGGKVVLTCLCENVKEVFDIAGFSNIFDICASQEEALKAF